MTVVSSIKLIVPPLADFKEAAKRALERRKALEEIEKARQKPKPPVPPPKPPEPTPTPDADQERTKFGTSGIQVELFWTWPAEISKADLFQPTVTQANLPDIGKTRSEIPAHLGGFGVGYIPFKQPDLFRLGLFYRYQNPKVTQEKDNYVQETSIQLHGAGLFVKGGPLLDFNQGGFYSKDYAIAFIGVQLSLGFFVASVDQEVTRPYGDKEGAESTIFSSSPFAMGLKMNFVDIKLGKVYIESGIDTFWFVQGTKITGDVVEGDFNLFQLRPSVTAEVRF